jgi:hypothetical protein
MVLLVETEGAEFIDSSYYCYFLFDTRKQFVAITLEADSFFLCKLISKVGNTNTVDTIIIHNILT